MSALSGSSADQISSPTPKKSVTGPELLDQFRGQRTFGDRGHFDHLAPPLQQVEIDAFTIAERGRADRPEGDIIGPGLACVHAFVAGHATIAADDGVATQFLTHIAHLPRAIGQMHAIKSKPLHHQKVVLDHNRHIAGMADHTASVGGAGDHVFVLAGQCQPHAGNIDAIQHGSKAVGKAVHQGRAA